MLVPHIYEVIFQSTHPVWGGTIGERNNMTVINISIHPPRVGWDLIR